MTAKSVNTIIFLEMHDWLSQPELDNGTGRCQDNFKYYERSAAKHAFTMQQLAEEYWR